MRRFLLILGLLVMTGASAGAGGLTLVATQEGDPNSPRALILIHAAPGSEGDFDALVERWQQSWGVRQHCSIYVFSYKNGLTEMPSMSQLGADLAGQIETGSFKSSGRAVTQLDGRQPQPQLGRNVELILVGHGVGGLVATAAADALSARGIKVSRRSYYGSRTFNYLEFLVLMAQKETASALGAPRATEAVLRALSAGWREVAGAPLEGPNGQASAAAPPSGTPAYGKQSRAPGRLPVDNVLYGTGTRVTEERRRDTDRVVEIPTQPAEETGYIMDRLNKELLGGKEAYSFLIQKSINPQDWSDYLMRRAKIESYFARAGATQNGTYFDERSEQMLPAFAPPAELYFYMWLGPLPDENA
ncbi:MAG: hypothetical protein HY319_13510 [Armatimonadetes bacterium]|nr:hypothetical protein [Armatimonadota bacterium]